MMEEMAKRAASGETVSFKPRGNSMQPIIASGDEVLVAPIADAAKLEVGDIVLVRVAGSTYLHLVDAVDHQRERVRIANNRGRVNGWAPWRQVHGICISVRGIDRRREADKALGDVEGGDPTGSAR